MAPNISTTETKILTEEDFQKNESLTTKIINDENDTQYKREVYVKDEKWFTMKLKWKNIIFISLLHISFVYVCFTFKFFENLKTLAWIFIMYLIGGIGVTGGAHRFWTHHAYKAKWPLRVILVIMYSSSGLNNLYDWVRDHRVHHKYTDTDADPHNSNRGFFFSHVGWLMVKKNSEVIRRGRETDMSDLLTDPIAIFYCKHYSIFRFVFAFLLPVMMPVYGWNETLYRALVSQIIIRYTLLLNIIWSVNSAAHIWGSKPYNGNINPTENWLIAFFGGGEGWHNYHHVFPWDYKAAELGSYMFNLTTMFIDFFAKIGWAYDLKQPSEKLVRNTAIKKGDGSHSLWNATSHSDNKIK